MTSVTIKTIVTTLVNLQWMYCMF